MVNDSLKQLIKQVVEPMGYELIGAQYLTGSGHLLRVYIDHEHGIGIEDCVQVSQQLSAVFDVEDPIPGHYQLEVSSPGLDRPLFEPEHYQRFIGHEVNIRLLPSISGRRRYKGVLMGFENDQVKLKIDGEIIYLPFEQIGQANLVPQFD